MQPLLAGPRLGLDLADVEAALRLEHMPRIRHGVTVLNTSDVPTGEALAWDAEHGAEVRWSYRSPDRVAGSETSAAAVRRTASLRLMGPPSLPLEARRLQLWTELSTPAGQWCRWHLGVFVATTPPLADDGALLTRDLDLADKTYRYASRTLTSTLQVPAATAVVEWVRADLASRFGESSFAFVSSTTTLAEDMTFEVGTSLLEVYSTLLGVAGYDALTVDEDGRPQARPFSDLANRGPEATYGPGTPIVTAGRLEPLLPTLPNVIRFVARQGPSLPEEGNGYRTVRNDATGPASILSRGEEVEQIVEVDAENQAELEAVAAADAQRYFAGGGHRYSGHLGFNPRLSDRDVVGLSKPRLGLLTGAWLVTAWTIPLRAVRSETDVLVPVTLEQRVEVTS